MWTGDEVYCTPRCKGSPLVCENNLVSSIPNMYILVQFYIFIKKASDE